MPSAYLILELFDIDGVTFYDLGYVLLFILLLINGMNEWWMNANTVLWVMTWLFGSQWIFRHPYGHMSFVISQNMTYPSLCHLTYPSYDIWQTQNMSIWVSTEPAGQQEPSSQYETRLKIHFKWKWKKWKVIH